MARSLLAALRRLSLGALTVGVVGCSLLAKSDLGFGIGFACTSDDECQGKVCAAGACASRCTSDAECPAPSKCSAATSLCAVGGCTTDVSCGKGNLCEAGACKAGCRDDAGCEAGQVCEAQACRAGCRKDDQCPAGQICRELACKATLRLGAIFSGTLDGQDGWTTSHKLGLDVAAQGFPDVRYGADAYSFKEGVRKAADITKAIDQYAADGAAIIVTTSRAGTEEAIRSAPKYPNVKFVAAGARKNGSLTNVGAYAAKSEPAWYVAGRLGGRVSDKGNKCIGMILPTPTRELIRDTNAFIRGARKQVPDVKVVIRWLGAERDPATSPNYTYNATTYAFGTNDGKLFREELLAAQIADLGCTLVAHRTETQRSVLAVEKRLKIPVKNGTFASTLFSLGADSKESCRDRFAVDGDWYPSCLGTAYWNWAGVYTKILDQVQRGVWKGLLVDEGFRADADAILKFELSPFTPVTGINAAQGQAYLTEVADAGFDSVFVGPYKFTGQRDLDRDGNADANQTVGVGESVSSEELERMCWFAEGAYELPDPTVVTYESLIPAMVPYGPAVTTQTSTLNENFANDRRKYGDVINFVKSNSEDPQTVMSCPLN